jgi:hypothetical protein
LILFGFSNKILLCYISFLNEGEKAMTDYITSKEAAQKWGISDRRVQILCNEGRIPGAKRHGWSWAIPVDAEKPKDARELRKRKHEGR